MKNLILIATLFLYTNLITAQKITFDVDSLILKDNIIKKDSSVFLITLRESQKMLYPSPIETTTKRFGLSLSFDIKKFTIESWAVFRDEKQKEKIDSQDPIIKQLLDERDKFLEENSKRLIEAKEANKRIKQDKTSINGIR